METFLIFAGLDALVWSAWKLSAPWRKYYDEYILPLEKELASAESRRADKERDQSKSIANAELFTRDFRAEILRHQEAKSAAYDRLNPMREQKAKLHKEMDDVRSKLNSWHRSSRGFLGNKGKKIKDDSVLGWIGLEQTVAQKESLGSRRLCRNLVFV